MEYCLDQIYTYRLGCVNSLFEEQCFCLGGSGGWGECGEIEATDLLLYEHMLVVICFRDSLGFTGWRSALESSSLSDSVVGVVYGTAPLEELFMVEGAFGLVADISREALPVVTSFLVLV